jgi:predicted negative regulator of RcsB-dependent stress response
MKRTERQHLRDNELANIAASARNVVDERKGQIIPAAIAIIVIAAAAIGYFTWRSRIDARAHTMLADAMVIDEARVGPPPAPGQPAVGLSFATEREKHQAALTKFKTVADEFPSSDAGVYARYREATTYMALGVPASAAQSFQQVIDHGGNSLYAQMARLGLAEAQAQTGQYEPAINMFKDLAQRKDGQVPVDGVLIRLGRTYLDAGKRAEAEQTFNRLVQEFPDSPFSADARRELDQLKKAT